MKDIFYNKKLNKQKGIASLPTIIALSVLILVAGVSITGISLVENLMSHGQKQSSQALLYAEAGARDALMKIARNKNYSCSADGCYTIDMASNGCASSDGCARLSVSDGTGASADPKIITSKGQVKNYTRKVEVRVVFDESLNGEIASVAWQEITN